MKVGIYTRVSTASQDTAMQTQELRAYCDRRGLTITAEYTDKLSGSKKERPGLNALMAAARKREFDAVLVYRYDRFARSLLHLADALDEFRKLGIDFISLHEGVDTTTANGRLVFGIFASIAEFEREMIAARVRSGLAQARRQGKVLGRPRLKVSSAKVEELRKRGLSWTEVAAKLQIPRSVCQRALVG